jgi:pyruvate formate lyase activating enzyme
MDEHTMTNGIVFDIKKFSLHDGPGIRTTVFLKGCGLRCWWCHNPESQYRKPELMLNPAFCIGCGACVAACEQGAIGDDLVTDRDACTHCGACVSACCADARAMVGQVMTVDEVMALVMRDVAFYDESRGGVTFSGGEPLLQPAFLLALLKVGKAQGLHTTVDTCGYAPAETLEAVGPDTDLFLYDLKLMDDAQHRQVTGVSNALILDNLRALSARGSRVILRVPVVPGINDDAANIDQIGALAVSLPGIERVDILAYHRVGGDKYARLGRANPMPPAEPPSDEHMAAIKRTLENYKLQVKIGG